jgi:hypothetical protein
MRYALVLMLLAALCACKPKEKKREGPPPPPADAPAQLGTLAARLMTLAVAKDAAGIRVLVDPEMGLRLEAAFLHAQARPVDQLPVAQKGASAVADPAQHALKREEIVQRLSRALAKSCLFAGAPELRTPKWPVKKREGWDFILETAAMTDHVYDAYAQCTRGYAVEVRFARRAGATEWKIVGAQELPFGVTRPTTPPVARWD